MDGNIINIVKQYAELVKQYIPVSKILLYGSYARGNERTDSDIDVAVIVDKSPSDFLETETLLFKLRRQIDTRIEPVLIEKDYDKSGFLDNILEYGIVI